MVIFCSAFVTNFAMSLFRTHTSRTSGSFVTVVVGDVRRTVKPVSKILYSPCNFFLERLVTPSQFKLKRRLQVWDRVC